MRYLNLQLVLTRMPTSVKAELEAKHQQLESLDDTAKEATIANGDHLWKKARPTLEGISNGKCWYTESKNPGCVNDVDHFRPKTRSTDRAGNTKFWYWFLAFDPENYRLSCQFANRRKTNPVLNGVGGKHNHFPLLDGQLHATDKTGIVAERPLLLDPCVESDCHLLRFQPDGRPVIAPESKNDPVSFVRVEKSKLLLNLDYPTFNEDREKLYNKVKSLVQRGDNYGPGQARSDIQNDLRELMHPDSAYSSAAECYIRCFRDREWVEELFVSTPATVEAF